MITNHGSSMSEAEDHLFDLMLKQSDIEEGHLPIPGIHAETHFSNFNSSSGETLTVNQTFVDKDGKNWVFELSCFFGIFYTFTDGWRQFVDDKGLVAGDTVSFWRTPKTQNNDGDYSSTSILVGYKKGAHQVLDEMPNLDVSEQSSSCTSPTAAVGTSLCLGEDSSDAHGFFLCEFPGCSRDAYGGKRFCKAHGGLKTVAEDQTEVRWAHRWRPRKCTSAGCTRFARPGARFCKAHNAEIIQSSHLGQCSSIAVSEVTEVEEGKYSSFSDCSATGTDDPLSLSLSHHPLFAEAVSSPNSSDMMILEDAFRICSLFPSDQQFDKSTLVQLWMAYGIFDTDTVAAYFFDGCVSKGYFELYRTYDHQEPTYKFKVDTDLLTLKDTIRIDGNYNLNHVSSEASHLSISCTNFNDFNVFKRFNQLITLVFIHGHELSFKQVPRDFFLLLEQLRILDLSNTHLTDLPSSVGCMKCLCYLDLSRTPIKRLPETLDRLVKLQTLKLKACSNLSVLPKGMRKLVNLCHLDFDVIRQLNFMPKGMGDLTKLQTLSAFLVGLEGGCSIKQLKNMNYLSGSFCISRLENVFSKDDADEACLSNKSQIKKLELHWTDSLDEDVVGYGEVLSSLQPNTRLEGLKISCYGGSELPSWICERAFVNLVSITLFEFENCLALPSLGQLPSLRILEIVGFHKLRAIGHNFYGGLQGYSNAFPMLKSLTVENMFGLEEWTGIKTSNFPQLMKLTVKDCPKLHTLCSLSSICSLKSLEIIRCEVLASCLDGNLSPQMETFIMEDCPMISARFLDEGGQDRLKVAHIPCVWIDHQEMSYGQPSSQEDAV